MSILDDAIREHLELKRQHGADETELKKLEDEAFGPPTREEAEPLAEAPTQFMDAEAELAPSPPSGGRRVPNVADLQEPPPPPAEKAEGDDPGAEATDEPQAAEHDLPTPAPDDRPSAPDAGLQPDPDAPRAPEAAEREAIADQPTEMFDVEGQFEDTAESASPADEALLEAEQGEPRVTGPVGEEPEDEFDDFFSDQRLSDELTRALDEPLADEPSLPSTEEALAGIPDLPPHTDEHEAPRTDEHDAPGFEEPSEEAPVPHTDEHDFPPTDEHERPEADSTESEQPEYRAEPGHEDVLEDTPEFLEDSPEDENAWFEQRPPKDFDFDD